MPRKKHLGRHRKSRRIARTTISRNYYYRQKAKRKAEKLERSRLLYVAGIQPLEGLDVYTYADYIQLIRMRIRRDLGLDKQVKV